MNDDEVHLTTKGLALARLILDDELRATAARDAIRAAADDLGLDDGALALSPPDEALAQLIVDRVRGGHLQ